MRRQAQHVHSERTGVEVEISCALHGVGVHDDGAPSPFGLGRDDFRYVRNWLHGANLVVGVHDAHNDGPVGDRPTNVVGIDQSVGIDVQVCHVESGLFEGVARVEHCMVLYAGCDDVIAGALERESRPPDSGVVRLCPAAGEDHLAHACAEHLSHRFAGVVYGLASLLGKRVDAGGIAETGAEVRQHRLQRLGAHRSRGGMVHVDGFRRIIHRSTGVHIVARGEPPHQSGTLELRPFQSRRWAVPLGRPKLVEGSSVHTSSGFQVTAGTPSLYLSPAGGETVGDFVSLARGGETKGDCMAVTDTRHGRKRGA